MAPMALATWLLAAQAALGTLGTSAAVQTELQLLVGVGASTNLLDSRAGRHYLVQALSWGRELTPERGTGPLRGRFVWAGEVTPIFAQTSPSRLFGFGATPVQWRWNFSHRRSGASSSPVPASPRWSAFAELAMGGLWTSRTLPEGTSRVNFTAHWGGGVRVRTSATQRIVVAYRLQHISNGNAVGANPGINAHVVTIGWAAVRPR